MSDLFMDMHRRRRRWHTHQTTPPTSTSATTTTSESPSSTQDTNDHNTFSHHNYSTRNGADAATNANYNYNIRIEGKEEKHDNNDNDNDDDDNNDEFANILSLKLRKPKHWKWELSTSKSCSNIALPRILLYDHKGQLLVDAQGDDDESVYKQKDYEKPKRDKSKKRSHHSKQEQSQYQQRSATTNLTHSIRKALEKEFNGLQIQEATPSPEPYSHMSNHSSHRSRKAIDFNTTDLPDYGLSRRSSSLRGVRFNVEDDEDPDYYESQIPEFLPTPPSTTTPTSSSSGPREKRKYRRSQSSGRSSAHSGSILERFSYQKGRFSSPEYAEEKEVIHGPRYFLRTSKAGTLVVQEDSFSQHPRRRRRTLKNRSTESLQSMQKSSLSSTPPAQQQSACNSPTPGELNCNRKQQPIRRHLTDGNILLNKQLSTSEEDVAVAAGQKQLMDNVNSRHLRKYVQARNQAKDLDYSPDVHQNGKVR
ncbi:probable WRKY transcription factor protein 1 [Calliphora vicina]|uniref:probable WRKY transcription factor protein 1 n=1 Tax=Calliphora vicina TaxID=7373 RepID=UPI00325BBD24